MNAVVDPRGTLVESLEARAKRRFGHIPPALIVSHVIAITPRDELAVQSAALEALIRRMSFALRDGLQVSAKPKRTLFGSYQTRGKNELHARRSTRPYATELESVAPLRGSCDCPDFVRSSLGLCKHLLAVLDWLHEKPTRSRNAARGELHPSSSSHLAWDFRSPLTGGADRLGGLSLQGPIPKTLARAFDRRGRIAAAVFFTGAESQAQRNRAIVDFHERPEVKVMFLSDAGGVGLNLQRAANACINLELPWNPAVLEQRISRIYRLGQKAPIDVYNLVNEYGIEARIANILGTKRALFASVFDGTSDEVTFEGATSFMARLERLVDLPDLAAPPRKPTIEPEPEELGPEELTPEELAPEERAPEEREDRARNPETLTRASRPKPPAPPALPDVASLLRALRIERTTTGALRIEAPPEAADALAAMFEGMARLVASAPARSAPAC